MQGFFLKNIILLRILNSVGEAALLCYIDSKGYHWLTHNQSFQGRYFKNDK